MKRCPKCGCYAMKTTFDQGVVVKKCQECSAEFEALKEKGKVLHIWVERFTTHKGGDSWN